MMSDLPLKLTLKSGAGYDAPWLTIDANDPDDLVFKLDGILAGESLQKSLEVASLFQAARNVGAEPTPAPVQQQAAPAQQGGWGQRPQQQAAPAAPPYGGPANGMPHPEGIVCPLDGVPVVYKKTPPRRTDGKSFEFWSCPNQKSKDDGHYSAFAN